MRNLKSLTKFYVLFTKSYGRIDIFRLINHKKIDLDAPKINLTIRNDMHQLLYFFFCRKHFFSLFLRVSISRAKLVRILNVILDYNCVVYKEVTFFMKYKVRTQKRSTNFLFY